MQIAIFLGIGAALFAIVALALVQRLTKKPGDVSQVRVKLTRLKITEDDVALAVTWARK